MGKQAQAKGQALANALKTTGPAAQAPVKKEEPVKEAPKQPKPKPEPKPEQKTKKQVEAEQRQLIEDNERQRVQFYVDEAAEKVKACKGAEVSVTYIEDKDTRKPKAISDLSEYWRANLGILPFMPSDNVGTGEELPPDIDPADRLAFLELFREQLQKLLKMKFHIFWSQFIYDEQVRKALDSYLRFCLRSHDVARSQSEEGESMLVLEEGTLATDISRCALAVFLRLSRPQETPHEFISPQKYGEIILDNRIFDIPKLIDICAIYGDSNRSTVTKIVHSVFSHQPRLKAEFEKAVVGHMLGGLHQCCAPLKQSGTAARPESAELGIDECLTFLPDVLSCFNAVFCLFPEDCVEMLVGGSLAVRSGSARVPLDELMVILHDSVLALEQRGGKTRLTDIKSLFRTIRMLLCRLLSYVLGFQMAPRRGAGAFDELLEWCKKQEPNRTEMLHDLGKHGLDNVAIEWHASGLVDEARMDFLETLCGSMLPPEARTARQRHARAAAAKAAATASGGGAVSGPSQPAAAASSKPNSGGSASDAAKIREVREIVGNEFGEGFILQCLLHYGFSVPSVVNAIMDGSLPPQISTLPHGLKMNEPLPGSEAPTLDRTMSADDKRRIVDQNNRMNREAVERAKKVAEAKEAKVRDDAEYDDDAEEEMGASNVRVAAGNNNSDSEQEKAESGASSGDEGQQWGRDRMKGGKFKGSGKGKGKSSKGPTSTGGNSGTVEARRKDANKARIGNHNRKQGADRKMGKGMS